MNISRWVGFVGAGVVLGACSGYSSLGEVAGGGGESGEGDGIGGSQSMGAKGGQGYGGTIDTGGALGMGASPGMVGGGSSTGAVGGIGIGGYGGTAMGTGAVGGTDGALRCMTDAECPPPPPFCNVCDDGTPACPTPLCSDSICVIYQPSCPSAPEPVPCMTVEECPMPVCAEGFSCPEAICAGGYCGHTLPTPETPCDNAQCGDPCMAPDGVSGTCDASGLCTDSEPGCEPFSCRTQDDCVVDLDAFYCGEDQASDVACLDGVCQLLCATQAMCSSSMDCPKEASDDPCTTGPWECPQGFCARRYEECSAPMR